MKLKSGKLVNIDGVNNVGSAGKSLPAKQDVDRRCGMECIPEHILIPLGAGHLEGQTCNLAAVSPDPTAPLVYHAEAVLGVVLEQILEHVADVDVGEPGTWEVGVKVVEHCLHVGCKGNHQLVHRIRALPCFALRKDAWDAPHHSQPRDHKFPSSQIV